MSAVTTTHSTMPSHAATVTIHQPAPFEKWLATQPVPPKVYAGRHRGRPAPEVSPDPAPVS